MFNTNTFYGTDGVLTLSDPDGITPEVFGEYFGEGGIVGRVTNVSLAVSIDVKAFHELGSHAPRELRAGNISIGGTVDRAFINGALAEAMVGPDSGGGEDAG